MSCRESVRHSTPVFEEKMAYVVFRPYWNVPHSIAKAEYFSRIARIRTTCRKGIDVVNSRQEVVTSGRSRATCSSNCGRASSSFGKRGSQELARTVKFIFPNDYSVYMHDTPAQNSSRSRRISVMVVFDWESPRIWPSGCCAIIRAGTWIGSVQR